MQNYQIKNPNVYYELGYALALQKKCILLTQEIENIPFDLKHKRHIKYKNLTELIPKLEVELEYYKKQLEEDNKLPFSLDTKIDGVLEEVGGFKKEASLNLSVDLHNKSKKPIKEINSFIIHFKSKWDIDYMNERLTAIESDLPDFSWRYYLKTPSNSIAKSGWLSLRFNLRRFVVYKSQKEFDIKSKTYSGEIILQLITDHETYNIPIEMSTTIENELPF